MTDTPKLDIPLLAEAQESPDIPINDGSYILDALVQGNALERERQSPPVGPQEGDTYLLAASGLTGAFVGHASDVAVFQGGGWRFYQPRAGWTFYVEYDADRFRFDGGSPGEWFQDTATIEVSTAGSPSLDSSNVRHIVFDNADVEDLGGGTVRVTPGSGATVDVVGLDSPGVTAAGVNTLEFQNATVSEPVPGTALIVCAGTGGGSSDANVTPDTHPASQSVNDDEFETGSSIDTTGARFSGATPWAWRNQGAATAVVHPEQGALVLTTPTAVGVNLRLVEQAISGSTWRIRAKIVGFKGTNVDFAFGGITVANSGSGKTGTWMIQRSSSSVTLQLNRYNSATSQAAGEAGVAPFDTVPRHNDTFYLEIEQTATQLIYRYSFYGVDDTFVDYITENLATFFTSIDRVGLIVSTGNGSSASLIVDWFRKVA